MLQRVVLRGIFSPPPAFALLLWLFQAALLVAATPAWANHDNENEQACAEFLVVAGADDNILRPPVYEFRIPNDRGGTSAIAPGRPHEVTWTRGTRIGPITLNAPQLVEDEASPFPNRVEQGGWSTTPELPAGITLTETIGDFVVNTGTISGTLAPDAPLLNRRAYSVTGRNCHGAGGALTLIVSIISGPPNVAQPMPTPERQGRVGDPIEPLTFANTGGRARWSIVSPLRPGSFSAGLLDGLHIDPTTGTVSGTPLAPTPSQARYTVGERTRQCPAGAVGNRCTYIAMVENAAGSSRVSFVLEIAPRMAPPSIADLPNPANAVRGVALAAIEFVNRGGPVQAGGGCTVSPALPGGLTLAAAGGACRISGTPQAAAARAEYTVTARNDQGSSTATVTLIVRDPPATGDIVVSIQRTDSGILMEERTGRVEGPEYEAVFAITLNGPALSGDIEIPFQISGDRIQSNGDDRGDFYGIRGTPTEFLNERSDRLRGVLRLAPSDHSAPPGSRIATTHTLTIGAKENGGSEAEETFTVTLDNPMGAAASQVKLSAAPARLSASATIAGDSPATLSWRLFPGAAQNIQVRSAFQYLQGSSNVPSTRLLVEGDTAEFRLGLSDALTIPIDLVFEARATDYPSPYNAPVRHNPACCPDLGDPASRSSNQGRVGAANSEGVSRIRFRLPAGESEAAIRVLIREDGIAEGPIPDVSGFRTDRLNDDNIPLLLQGRTHPSDPALGPAAGTVELALVGVETVGEGIPTPVTAGPNRAAWLIGASQEERTTYTLSGPTELAGASSGAYTVTLEAISGTLSAQQVIAWAVSAGSGDNPAAAADFGGSFPSGSLTFASGAAIRDSMSFNIAATGAGADNRNEADKTFVVTLSTTAAPAPSFSNNGQQVRITDPDAISVSLARMGSGAVTEGGNATFTVTLSGGRLTADANIPYRIGGAGITPADVSATGLGSNALSGTLTIAASSSTSATTTADITVTALADNLNEGMETLTVTLGDRPTTAGAIALTDTVADRSATAAIAASDPITVSIAAPSPATVEEGQSVQFTVTLGGASAGSVAGITVTYTVSGTTDTPTDANGGSIELTAGQTTGTLTLAIPFSQALDDSSPDETLSVTLGAITVGTGGGAASAAASPGNSASVTVSYITAAHTFSFTNPAADIAEGSSATYTVSRSGPAIAGAGGIVLSWTYTAGTASAADFAGGAAPAGGTLTFTGSETSQTFTITTAEDALSEPGETFTLGLSAAPAVLTSEGGVALPADITVTIGESDRPVTVQLAGPPASNLGDATEGQPANFTVSFAESVTTTAPVEVDYTITFPAADPEAMPPVHPASAADFSSTTGTFSIPVGMSSATVSITSTDDRVNEDIERYIVTISNARGGGAIAAPVLHATRSADTSIGVSDPVRVQLARSAGQSGNVREGNEAEFTVSLTLAADGSPGATSGGAICVPFQVDVVSLASSMSPVNTAESGPDIEGVRDCNGNPVQVQLTPRLNGDAFSQAEGGVLIPAGQSSADFSIRAAFDGVEETANEDMVVEITAPTARAGAASVSLARESLREETVPIENVNSLRTLAVSEAALTGDEDSASRPDGTPAFVSYTVRIEGEPLTEEVSVDWSLAGADGANLPGAAASGSGLARQHGGEHTPDFGAATILESGGGTVNANGISGTLVFPVGTMREITRTVRVPLTQDALNEGAERLTLTVSDPCPATGVCTLGGGGGGRTPALQLGTGERTETIPPSDPAMLRITRVGSGTVVSGEGITYAVSLGTTFLRGESAPVLASEPLTVMVPLFVDNADSGQSFTVEVPTGQSSGQAEVSATVLSQALGQTGTPMLSLGRATVTGAPGPSGGTPTQMAQVTAPDPASTDPAVRANLPAPVQTAAWELSRTTPAAEAPEGGNYEITFTLRGSDVPTGGLSFDWSVTGSAATDGGASAVAADFARAVGYTCGAAAVGARCTSLPGGSVSFTAGNTSQTISIDVRDDSADNPTEGRTPDGMIRAEGFTLTFTALSGTDSARVEYAAGAQLPGTPLQVDIPALRADLSVANATAAEGASAIFQVSLSGFLGGDATTQPIIMAYMLSSGLQPGGAELGVDFTAPTTPPGITDCPAQRICARIPPGAVAGEAHRIEVPLVLDGVLEPRESFTLTITGATGGGGTIRLVPDPNADPVVVANEISATGTITDDADQGARRRQRVGALVTVLDRQTAFLATDAISARLSRPRSDSAQPAPSLSIANRNLIGATSLRGTGAAGTGAAGVAGTEGEGFGGLGAGLAGAANMGTRTALPSLAQVLNGSSFRFGAASDLLEGLADFADGIEVWGSGGYVDLRSESRSSGLNYDGESIAAFIGADAIVPQLPNLLAGLAVGWSAGGLDFTDRAGGFEMRGELDNDAFSLHPYFGWQLSPHANAWLVLGIGAGSVDIEENEGNGADAISRKLDGGDSAMLMFSTGISGAQQIGETGDLKLRFALTRVNSRVDSGRFDDGALLPKTRGRSLRVGGEAEAGRRITLDNGLSLRPFGTLRVRLDNASTDSGVENAAMDWGAGITAAWTDLGLDGRFAFRRQLNDTGDEEQGATLDVNFAPGATGQGIAIHLQTALQQRRPGLANLDGNLGNALHGANSALSNPLGGANTGGASSANAGMQHSLSGEIAYGVALRYFGRGNASRAALLTPYGRFNLGSADTRWAAGLRLANPGGLQLGLEAGLDLNSSTTADGAAASPRSYDLLLTGRLRF